MNCISASNNDNNVEVVEEKEGMRKRRILSECSGNGVCNRETGVCECNENYSGVGCSKSS